MFNATLTSIIHHLNRSKLRTCSIIQMWTQQIRHKKYDLRLENSSLLFNFHLGSSKIFAYSWIQKRPKTIDS